MIAARFDGSDPRSNTEAVYAVLRWNKGSFEFNALEVDMDDEVQMSTTKLLMEGARVLDETLYHGN